MTGRIKELNHDQFLEFWTIMLDFLVHEAGRKLQNFVFMVMEVTAHLMDEVDYAGVDVEIMRCFEVALSTCNY